MSRVDAAAPMDRLPWLPDEPKPQAASRRGGTLVLWGGAAILAFAAGGFWIGLRSIDQDMPAPARHSQATTTVPLPVARPSAPEVRIEPQQEVRLAPVPQVRPAPARQVRIAAPHVERPEKSVAVQPAPHEEQAAPKAEAKTTAAPAIAAPAPQPFAVPRPWPPRVVQGAAGRLVQVGAFGSIRQAKRGWWFMVRAYPAMAHLPAVVRPTRNSHGRVFYRFQVGTTSQAHSEVLCQRMSRIGLSCAVVGLPWKAKVER